MVSQKRKRTPEASDPDSDSDGLSSENSFEEVSEDEVDISTALAGKRPRVASRGQDEDGEDGDDDLADLIKTATSKANVKGGTEILKKTKGKSKIVKGEVGGGSFQSMGTSCP